MKKLSLAVFVLCFVVSLLGFVPICGAQTKPLTIMIGYENHPGEPVDLGCNHWKKLVEERSNGTIKVQLYPSSQLGSKNELIDQMLAGIPVITLADGAFYADRGVPDFGIVFGPYLFDSWDDCWKLVKSDWWKEQSKKLEEKGLKILTANWIYGDRQLLVKKPVRKLADLKGMKIRVPNNTIQIKGFEVLGAVPTPMPLGEVYTALQQGVVDGLENPIPVLYKGKFAEVAKYLVLTGHVKNFTTWICGTKVFNSLTPEQQKIIMEAGDEAGKYNNSRYFDLEKESLEKMKADKVEVIQVDLTEFKEAAKKFYELPEITSRWSPNLYQTVKNAMK
ncbi:MAG: C4-dicarboxylate TRAP transporter substrate-binding protein [Synergistetes bacterium]|nr:C4-dicarboxylate TRAP transporter substrate-binding protein [Synergistota bacterium]MDW8191710.1 C4-dicarboxylate TRAP transporter substrate-binding protein [Synergistota bacterium]